MRLSTQSVLLLVMLATHCAVGEERSDSLRFREIIKVFDLKFYNDDSFLILIPLNGCSTCIRPTLEFIQNNRELNNVTCIITDIGMKRISEYIDDIHCNGVVIIPDDSAKLYSLEPYINSPVIYYVRHGQFHRRVMLDSQNSPVIFSEILMSAKI